jgi:UDP-N-acetylmuramate dehydrogenase
LALPTGEARLAALPVRQAQDFALRKLAKLQENIPLAPLTTLDVGGSARYFVRAESEDEVVDAVEYARANRLELFVLGGGSNVLISDAGFDGLVLQVAIQGITPKDVTLTAAAGEDWDTFVAYCVENDLAGVECLSGIPGLVGGTPVQNVGAYGQEVAERIAAVRCFDRSIGEIVTLGNADCGFTYRTSIFNSTHRDRYIVLSVTFALERGGRPKIVYKDLVEHFAGSTPTLAETREAVLAIRRAKSMVIDAADPNSRSAGSFFKNPVVDKETFAELSSRFERIPSFDFEDKVKVPAAWLIENAGFAKGFALGKAGISTKHTLALINRGGATAAELLALKEQVQRAVEKKFGIQLQPEPVFVGF